MSFTDQLIERLKATQGDIHTQSAVVAEFVLAARAAPEMEVLRTSLDVAALLHFFDVNILKVIMGISEADAAQRFRALKSLPFVEYYRKGDEDLRNVHESTRLGWRKQLMREAPERFRALSSVSADYFADDSTSVGRIEWIYHLLSGDPDRAATELEKLDRDWSGQAHPEHRYALGVALKELQDSMLINGRARVWTVLVLAWIRVARGEAAQLADVAHHAIGTARQSQDARAEAEANCLLGDVFQAQGKLEEAQAAFGEYLTISRRLAQQDPSNAGWQRELAVAHSRVGGVLEAQGKLQEAQAAFEEYLTISRRLAQQNPSNAGWQRELAVAHSRVGGVLEAQGKLQEAQAAFGEYLTISRRLAQQDPSNARWQRGLALACVKVARLLLQQYGYTNALPLYEEASRILGILSDIAPDYVTWVNEKQAIDSELVMCRQVAAAAEKE